MTNQQTPSTRQEAADGPQGAPDGADGAPDVETASDAADGRAALPPYSGDTPTCAACGYPSASTRYLARGRCIHPDTAIGVQPNPRLHRTCDRCDFQWDEALATP
jgi:ribosomal protein L37E